MHADSWIFSLQTACNEYVIVSKKKKTYRTGNFLIELLHVMKA